MTTWGLDDYLTRAQPLLLEAIQESRPPLLIANHPLLDVEHVIYPAFLTGSRRLLPEDSAALAGAYVHHWGPLYVAGKRLTALSAQGTGPVGFELLIPGRYSLEANAPVHIDGYLLAPGQSVDLIRGMHRATVLPAAEPATLRWGEELYRPAQTPPREEFFLGF